MRGTRAAFSENQDCGYSGEAWLIRASRGKPMLMASNSFWIMVIVVSAIWGLVAIVSKIVDGAVKTKQSRIELERDYLAQMVADLEEIKSRIDQFESSENAHTN